MDLLVFQLFHGLAGRSNFLDGAAVFFASFLSYLLVAVALWFVFRQASRRSRIFVFVSLALTALVSRGIITETIRFFYDRPRPFESLDLTPFFFDGNPSFPSGHAAFFFALGFVIFSFNRKLGWWFLGLALLNSIARIFAGVHWPTDILGGIVVAALAFFVISQLLKKYQPQSLKI
jgi:undecaprenyl-diphosphatase